MCKDTEELVKSLSLIPVGGFNLQELSGTMVEAYADSLELSSLVRNIRV